MTYPGYAVPIYFLRKNLHFNMLTSKTSIFPKEKLGPAGRLFCCCRFSLGNLIHLLSCNDVKINFCQQSNGILLLLGGHSGASRAYGRSGGSWRPFLAKQNVAKPLDLCVFGVQAAAAFK